MIVAMVKNKFIYALILAIGLTAPATASAQRDFLTPEEIEIVRDSQEIDTRIEVLTQAIDRRFDVLNLDVSAPKVKKKGEWGELPKGSRAELFLDIKRLLQKAVDDIDNLSERPTSAVAPDPEKRKGDTSFATLFPRAVRNLADASKRYIPVLKSELDASGANSEKGSILDALELCRQIIDSVVKLPAEVPKKAVKKT
jgi:hypothetical protein